MQANEYNYGALESARHIRLLRVAREQSRRDYQYSIIAISLDDAPAFEAVSYVWGDPKRSETLHLQDGSRIPITTSLKAALSSVTKVCKTGFLWIDQITINQTDLKERSAQVKVMGDIYRRSSRCIIWLNNYPSDDIELSDWGQDVGAAVHEFFQRLCREVRMNPGQRRISTAEGLDIEPGPDQASHKTNLRVRDYVLWFLYHPWFTRTWVYQEFVLAPRPVFLINDFELSGREVEVAFDKAWLQTTAWYEIFDQQLKMTKHRASIYRTSVGCKFLVSAARSRLIVGKPHESDQSAVESSSFVAYESLTFADVLDKMAANKTRDDHDHVYGFLGLVPNLLKHVTVDYTTSVEQAFATMMKAIVKDSKGLDLLEFARTEFDVGRSRLNLPSWCPDWTYTTLRVHLLCQDNLFCAAGPGYGLLAVSNCRHEDPPSSAWNELVVAGQVVDEVLHRLTPWSVYHTLSNLEFDPKTCTGRLPWEHSTLDLYMAEMAENNYPEGPHVSRESLLRTLFIDGAYWASRLALQSTKSLHRTDVLIDGVRHDERLRELIRLLLDTECDINKLPYDDIHEILHELSKAQYRRRIACCKSGRLALVSDRVQGGDQIVILHGSRAPVVLRPRPHSHYNSLGSCFYDGAMYGELADAIDEHARLFTLV